MEHVSHKMEHLIQRQKQLLEQSQANEESRSTADKALYVTALGGVAAGLTIAAAVWLAKSILVAEPVDTATRDRAVEIYTAPIGKLSSNIAQLSGRVESLTASVSDLEARFTHLIELTEPATRIGTQHSLSPQPSSDSAASTAAQMSTKSAQTFVPTHIVKSRVNLRPAASLDNTPITVLNVGTELEYLSESNGWYYVNTESHGKGWCSSDYLDALQHTSSAR